MSLLAGLRPSSLVTRENFAAARRKRRERGDWDKIVATATRLRVTLAVVLTRDARKETSLERRRLVRALAAKGWNHCRIARAIGRSRWSVMAMLVTEGWSR